MQHERVQEVDVAGAARRFDEVRAGLDGVVEEVQTGALLEGRVFRARDVAWRNAFWVVVLVPQSTR